MSSQGKQREKIVKQVDRQSQELIEQLKEQLKKANERLRRLDDVKSNFISAVSHELRTPLTSIKEGVSLLLEGLLGELNPKQEEFLKIVKRNTDRLVRLVNNLLDLSQLEMGGARFKKASTDIGQVISEVQTMMAPQFHQKEMKLVTSLSKDLPCGYIDSNRVKQVLRHLLENVLKFASQPGEVVIETNLCHGGDWGVWKDHPYVVVSVRDHGVGIAKDQIYRLFNKFEQLERKAGPGPQGAGLGLAICREIIERHGGRIWVEEAKDKGAVFSFTLPVYNEDLELSSLFEESKLHAGLEHNPLLVMIFPLAFNTDHVEQLRDLIQNQIRSSDRLFYYTKENAFYLFVLSERPAELSLLSRIQNIFKDHLPTTPLAWSFYPEDGEDILTLKQKAFQRAQAA